MPRPVWAVGAELDSLPQAPASSRATSGRFSRSDVASTEFNVQKEPLMSAARRYELVYIVTPDAPEEQVAAIHEQVEQTVQKLGGTLEKSENWGRRKLAYEIQHHKDGVYVLEVIVGGGELMKELDRKLKVIDQVIRHLVVRVDEEYRVAERTRTRRQETQARRRTARGLPPVPTEGERRRGDSGDDDGGEIGLEAEI
jgi:small subunit ribosomal protein S6